jgi:hypothetical protein
MIIRMALGKGSLTLLLNEAPRYPRNSIVAPDAAKYDTLLNSPSLHCIVRRLFRAGVMQTPSKYPRPAPLSVPINAIFALCRAW